MANDFDSFYEQAKTTGAQLNSQRGGGGGGRNGRPPAFSMRYKTARLSETPTRLRLVPLNPDEPFFLYYQRWVEQGARRTPVISNSHNGAKKVPDLVYYQSITQEDPKMLAAPAYAMTVIVLEDFHKTKVPDKNGKKDKNGALRMYDQLERCKGVDRFGKSKCEYCRDNVPKQFGDQQYISVSGAQKDALLEMLTALDNRCAGCFEGEIAEYAYECPECNHCFIDRYKDAVDENALQELLSTEQECPKCKKTVWVSALIECQKKRGNEFVPGCKEPIQLPHTDDLYGYDIALSVKKGSPGVAPIWTITGFAEQKDYGMPHAMTSPMDFDYFLSHMTLEEQSRVLGVANPWGQAAEEAVTAFFARSERAAPSAATSEEADKHSIPWGKEPA